METPPTLPPTLRVGVLVFPDFEPLDVWGFIQPFAIARFIGQSYSDPPPHPFEVVFISTEQRPCLDAVPAPVRSYNGPRVAPDLFLGEALDAGFHLVMVPGGSGTNAVAQPDSPVLPWLKALRPTVPILASVCTGSAVLAAAGVLDGRRATSNHQAFGWVTSFGPLVLWDNVSRWVDDSEVVTSAGVSAGIDMGFHLVERLRGRAVAEKAAQASEYHWQRDPQVPIPYAEGAVVPDGS